LEIDKENRRLSLGHKQLEENPWDIFEKLFFVGSIHEGIIIELLDKGAVISLLPSGVEGFSTPKHLIKEDGSAAQLEEKLSFKVIEFNKDSKRIILSHSRIYEDEQRAEAKKEATATNTEKKTAKKVKKEKEEEIPQQPVMEKTTLGDISELAELREKMEEDNDKK
jgi:small subunit ribosomal protein S1